jgi:Integrase zinc binding domain
MIAALVDNAPATTATASKSTVSIDEDLLKEIQKGYLSNPWCIKLLSASTSLHNISFKNGLWFIGDRLIVPREGTVCEQIFRLAHDSSGHFGFLKSYENIHNSFFWPGMRKDLEFGYIPFCADCM